MPLKTHLKKKTTSGKIIINSMTPTGFIYIHHLYSHNYQLQIAGQFK
jgi:hypothetical protein